MAGCAMIGQSVINIKSGGKGRLSSLVTGIFLMFLIVVLGEIVVESTVLTVVLTHNLAMGVFTGILLSAIFFVSKISKIRGESSLNGNKRIYSVNGELFFASVTELLTMFD